MKLSQRLDAIAQMIPDNSNVIDVGCDHGLLSIYLSNIKGCNCIASDVNDNALNSARLNKEKYKSNIEIRLTDGINGIQINNDDYIVIAGMGTPTIKKILDNKKLSNHLIISSNNHLYELRKYIISLGYKIVDEKYIYEHNKGYVIIKFIKGKDKYSINELKYGPFTIKNNDYLVYELEKLYKIKNKIKDSNIFVKIENQKAIKNVLKLIANLKGKYE